jgi:O-antigen/teichoic acid export membrane protein
MGNPVVSLVEDAGTAGLVVLALVVPLFALAVLGGFVAAAVLGMLWLRERRRRRLLERGPPAGWPVRQRSSE